MSKLDPDQQAVVDTEPGFVQVQAGAGSGKTSATLHRAARLSKLGSVLCVTFTSEAAKNLRSRAEKTFPGLDTSMFQTLHAFGLKFAHKYSAAFPFELADNPLAGDGVAAKAVFEATRNRINFRAFTSWISLQKRNRISPGQAVAESETTGKNLDMALAFRRYEELLRKQGVLDYDDLLVYMVSILEKRKDIRKETQFQHVLVDECQDICPLEWQLLKLLTEENKSLTCVGDENQSIFSFRGGDSEFFSKMEEMFPGTKKLYLGNNYRSVSKIVDFVRQAAPIQGELTRRFRAMRTQSGVDPVITPYSSDIREAEEVARQIEEFGPDSCAVLARTNLGLRPIEEELINRNVKYYLAGESGYWTQPEVQAILGYARCVFSPTDNAVLTALRSPFWPTRYMKKKVVADEAKQAAEKSGEAVWSLLKKHPFSGRQSEAVQEFVRFVQGQFGLRSLPAGQVIERLIINLRAIDYYKEEEGVVPDKNPVDNLKELIRAAERRGDLAEFLNFVRRVQGASRNRKGCCLTTIHSAKGREYPHVFLISANEGVLPSKHAVEEKDVHSEKCVWYTGVSRASESLHISYWGTPSRFLGRKA